MGIGHDNVRRVKVNERFQMDVTALAEYIEEDLARGYLPFCVVGSSGTVNTGACDPLEDLADVAARIYPHDLSQFLNNYYRSKGVEVLPGESVIGASSNGSRQVLLTKSGREISAEGVIAGIGIEPNLELAKSAGLQVGNGIQVDEYLVSSQLNIYAAGDVAEFYNPALRKRMRVEHEDNANSMGRLSGRNMAGASEVYHHLPFFYSDLFELGYEGVGELDSRLETIADWKEPFQQGIIYYLGEGRVRGVLLWNVWDKVAQARELISKTSPSYGNYLITQKASDWKIVY